MAEMAEMGEMGSEDCLAPLDHQETKETEENWDHLDHRERGGYQEHGDHREYLAPRELLEVKVIVETLASGPQGEQGVQGPPTGGAVYVRWGRTSCPTDQGTQLLYSGRAGGSRDYHQGGGANHLCMPDNPDYLQYDSGVQGASSIYGVEYRPHSSQPFINYRGHNVPCAVCYTATRDTVVMIPAKVHCPTNWTVEYTGYLMTENNAHHRSTYECVDKDRESVPGLNAETSDASALLHVEPVCSNGFSCGAYHAGKELTCVVCSR